MKVTINQIGNFGTLHHSHYTHLEMSSKEALHFDGRKRRKEGSVCEKRMNAETNHITPKSIQSRSSSSSTMSNAEIQVNKKVEKSTPKKGKAVEIVRQRSDLGIKKSPPQIKRARSATSCVKDEVNLVKLRKIKSDSVKLADNSLPLPLKFLDQKANIDENGVADFDEDLGIEKSRFEEEEDDGQVKAIMSSAEIQDLDLDLEEEEVEEEEVEKEIEVKVEIKDIVISLEEEKKKPKNFAIEEKNLIQSKDRSPPMVKKIAPAANHARIQEKLSPISDHHHGASSRLQTLADLIMWRDVSRSAFVFGVGAFAIISSSYTKDLNISFISVVSYLGLVYLAVSFIFRSLRRRGNFDNRDEEEYVVGEEEAVWLIKLVLPYLNEFLSKLRSLFSGDPATTMKLAVLLFILARCGSSITLWKMTKLGFFGVFMVPKLCSSYSSYLAAHGTFWIRRFGDAWESCSHKKAAAFGLFSLVWNMSSVVARIWTVFLLFVAYRYYQQCRFEEEAVAQTSDSQYEGKRTRARKSSIIGINKQGKVC